MRPKLVYVPLSPRNSSRRLCDPLETFRRQAHLHSEAQQQALRFWLQLAGRISVLLLVAAGPLRLHDRFYHCSSRELVACISNYIQWYLPAEKLEAKYCSNRSTNKDEQNKNVKAIGLLLLLKPSKVIAHACSFLVL